MTEDEKQDSYGAESITVLKGLEAVRLRPAMFIGSTDVRGLHHLVYELIDNSIDEVMAGFCTKIIVTINSDESLTVEDNGRGIPTGMHPTEGKTGVELAFGTLHAGGKFDHSAYKVSGGLHGVGASCVNALSTWLKVWVKQKGKIFFMEFQDGEAVDELKEIGTAQDTGTKITFYPNTNGYLKLHA